MLTEEGHKDVLRQALFRQTRLLDALINHLQLDLSGHADEKVISVCMLMVQSLGVSIHSVLRLTTDKDMAIRDCFGIARSASELAVNICYIAVAGADIASRAERHAFQKMYRDMERTGEVGGTSFRLFAGPRPPLEDFPDLAAAIAEFTGKNGKELADWTPDNISKRIDAVRAVDARAGMMLSGATIAIYRHASEFLHGTYFSVLYLWTGIGGNKVTKSSFLSRWDGHFASVFGALFFGTAAVLTTLAKKYGAPEHVHEEVAKLIVEVGAVLQAMDAAISGDDPRVVGEVAG